MSAEDLALGYKQLLEVERGWRDMKQTIDLRPVFHRREDRIRAHILLCWLALLLARIARTPPGRPGPNCGRELDKIQVGTFTAPPEPSASAPSFTRNQRQILKSLESIPHPASTS